MRRTTFFIRDILNDEQQHNDKQLVAALDVVVGDDDIDVDGIDDADTDCVAAVRLKENLRQQASPLNALMELTRKTFQLNSEKRTKRHHIDAFGGLFVSFMIFFLVRSVLCDNARLHLYY